MLVGKNASRARAEADDMRHAVPFTHSLEVCAGDYGELAGYRVIIHSLCRSRAAAGLETRLQILIPRRSTFHEVVPAVQRHAPGTFLALFAGDLGVRVSRVLGSGTTLDTAPLNCLYRTPLRTRWACPTS
jgi:L-lactate dehydrogenase